MHTILGAGGPVANGLTKELLKANEPIRLVSRTSVQAKFPSVNWQRADLLNANEVRDATVGSKVIYLCAGLVYDKTVWQQQWPVIMQNVINAARHHEARLIFFDNIYMYGLVNGKMTETTPYNPNSVKGEVRARIATMLMDEVKSGNLTATIARAPDFYGAESLNSFFDSMVLARLAKRERPQWLGSVDKLHNFIYVPDAAKAMYLLGQEPKSDGQVWHLPTPLPMTGLEFINLAATIFNAPAKYTTINKFMLKLAGVFSPVIRGSIEMYYQYDHDYLFSSEKFEKAFHVQPTLYEKGITELSQSLFKPEARAALGGVSLTGK
jgi:nucleoside-diphosphate-sugar epimerase